MEDKIKLIFDLDSAIMKEEILSLIAKKFNKKEVNDLVQETEKGNVPFVESFIKRGYILGKLPIDEITELIGKAELYEKVVEFIREHARDCIIATGNLKCWTKKILEKVNCEYYGSDCIIENNNVVKLTKVMRKELIVEKYKKAGYKVVFIGDDDNDLEAIRLADVSIAVGLTHFPDKSVLTIVDYLVFTEETLCRLLNQLY